MTAMNKASGPTTIPRRTLAAGALWTIPVIAIAQQANAYSTSAPNVTLTGTAVKIPGASCSNKDPNIYKNGYRYYMSAFNPPGKDACIVVTSVTVGGASPSDFKLWTSDNQPSIGCACSATPTQSIFVGADCSVNFTIDADMGNSANTSMTFTYNVYDASVNVHPNTYNNTTCTPQTGTALCTTDFQNLSAAGSPSTPVAGGCYPYCADGSPTPSGGCP